MSALTSGMLLVEKPSGMTSHDVVDRIRRVTGVRTVGHAGTLDPLAEGLLVILVGRKATKRQAECMAGEKEYLATVRLGAVSSTDDAEGDIVEMPKLKAQMPNEIQIRECLKGFAGTIEQTPPAYSAVKVGGQKAYEAARRGKPLALKPRRVTIREIELTSYAWPQLTLRVSCSSGTYIRALVRDIGQTLGCGAYLDALTRTRSGKFLLKDALALSDLTRENWKGALLQIPKREDRRERAAIQHKTSRN